MRKATPWQVGDSVWLAMGDKQRYPAVITKVLVWCDRHSDGYECQQYYADVTFPHEDVHEDVHEALVSHCMLTARTADAQVPQKDY
jgi:hypothetical protein